VSLARDDMPSAVRDEMILMRDMFVVDRDMPRGSRDLDPVMSDMFDGQPETIPERHRVEIARE
jgi:hypothetical protein